MDILNPEGVPIGANGILAQKPYFNSKGQPCITVNTGQRDESGNPIYKQQVVANATLRKDEWIRLDDAVVESARERLVIIDDLIAGGLTQNVGGLGTIISEWETSSEMTDAEATMDGETVVDKDRVEFGLDGVPIPIIHKDYSLSERTLQASRTRGSALDVVHAQEAGRSVARKSESMVFNGLPSLGASDSRRVYGLFNKPNRPVQQISDWSAATSVVSNETVLGEILSMVAELETEQRAFGPFNLYIPSAYARRFREDFKANSDKTFMARVLQEEVINKVRISDTIADGNVALVEMTGRTIDLAIASDIVNVQWSSGSGFRHFFKTYAAWAPRIRTDFDGRFGYIHGATST